jgi:hypothetical protein
LALIHEHHNDTTAVQAVCQTAVTAVTAAAGTPLHARPLINIAARVGGGSGGKGGVGGGDPVLALIAVVQRLTLHPDAALLVSGTTPTRTIARTSARTILPVLHDQYDVIFFFFS